MKKRAVVFILFILLISVLAACGNAKSSDMDKEPDKIHHNFLFFTEDRVNDSGESIGDLYIQTIGSDREKIASDVKQHHYQYVNDKNKVYFIDEENSLYEFSIGEEKVKLADDVYYFNGNYKDIVTYHSNDDDLYILQGEKEEKIATDVYQVEILGNDVYYSKYDGKFSVYNIESRKELDISDNVEYFQLVNNDGDLVYLNDESMLYFKANGEESIRVSGEEVNQYTIQYEDNLLIYHVYDDSANTLYASTISGSDVTTEKVANDVFDSIYSDNSIYYVNDDGNLYVRGKNEESATKLASDVYSIRLVDDILYFFDEDDNLFKQDGEDGKEKIGTDVLRYDVYEGNVVYLTSDEELFVNETKLGSGIVQYSYFYGNIAYATEDKKLYFMENLKDEEVVVEDLNEYSTASYQNQIFFNNTLTFADIAGFWKMDDHYGVGFLDIKKDGTMVDYINNAPITFTIYDASYRSMEVEAGVDGYLTIHKLDDDTLEFTDGYETTTLTKSTVEEADKYIKDVQYQEDVEDVKYTISEYLYAFTDAIYYGTPHDISYYVDESSSFYDNQVDFIDSLYERNIEEEVLDYQIKDVTSIDKDTFEAVVYEKFAIYEFEDWYDYTEEIVEQTSTYTLKRINGSFYITDLAVSTISEETANSKNEKESNDTVALAEDIYSMNCAACHGADLAGGAGPALKTIGAEYSQEELEDIILNGVASMPAFETILSDEEADIIISWLSDMK